MSIDIPRGEINIDIPEVTGADFSIIDEVRTESTGNFLTQYFNEMGRNPLLEAEQEKALAEIMTKGRIAGDRLLKNKDLSEPLRKELTLAQRSGLLARQTLYERNARLVVSIAKRYQGRGMTLEELISQGNIGLGNGIDKFDVKKGFRLSTYASWWIRQAIGLGLVAARPITFSAHGAEIASTINKCHAILAQRLGREPHAEEIAEEIGLETEKVVTIMGSSQTPLSLETPFGEDEDSTLGNLLKSDFPDPAEKALETDRKEAVQKAIGTELNEQETQVIIHRFGLFGEREKTFQEIGKLMGFSRARAEQVEKQALLKLREKEKEHHLHEYLEP